MANVSSNRSSIGDQAASATLTLNTKYNHPVYINIVINCISILISLSKVYRCRYRYRLYIDIVIVINCIPISISISHYNDN